jgi:hypothetical protein
MERLIDYQILEAVQLQGEPPAWLVTFRGFQIGGEIDRSGAGNLTFPTYAEAVDYVNKIARGLI